VSYNWERIFKQLREKRQLPPSEVRKLAIHQIIAEFSQEDDLPDPSKQFEVSAEILRQRELLDSVCLQEYLRPEQLPFVDYDWLIRALRKMQSDLQIPKDQLKKAISDYLLYVETLK